MTPVRSNGGVCSANWLTRDPADTHFRIPKSYTSSDHQFVLLTCYLSIYLTVTFQVFIGDSTVPLRLNVCIVPKVLADPSRVSSTESSYRPWKHEMPRPEGLLHAIPSPTDIQMSCLSEHLLNCSRRKD